GRGWWKPGWASRKPAPSRPSRLSAGTTQASRVSERVSAHRMPAMSSRGPSRSPGLSRSTMKADSPAWRLLGSVAANTTMKSAWPALVVHCLAPSSHVVVALAAGARADAAGGAAGVRLRQGERAQLAVGEGAAHVALLLPRVAVRQDRGHGQRGGGPGREEAGAAPGDLLGDDALLEQAEAGAAELLRHVAVEEPQLERLLDRRGRELAGLVVAGGDRADHLGGEPARGVPHRHLLLAEGEPDHTRSPLRRILPDGLVGISSTISTRRGSLK